MKQPEPENLQDKYEDKGAKCNNSQSYRLKTCSNCCGYTKKQ